MLSRSFRRLRLWHPRHQLRQRLAHRIRPHLESFFAQMRAITQAQNTQNQSGVGVCPINLFAGPNAGLPFPLLEPYVLARATSVQFYFTDLSGATNTLNLVLQGFQLVPQNAMQQGSAGRIVGI